MELTTEQLFKGKATRIKEKEYFTTEAYVTPFMERVSKLTNNFIINAKPADQISLTKEGEVNFDDVIYNRVWIQAILPTDANFPNHSEAIHLLYALDTRKPMLKIARSAINGACLNQCIFSPSWINIQELEPEKAADYKPIEWLMKQTSDISKWLTKLSNTIVPYKEQIINENLGKWSRNAYSKSIHSLSSKVNLAVSTPFDAYKLLYENKNSNYYVEEGQDTTMFNIYNAFTDIISHNSKDIVNPLEKTLLLKDILELV